MSRKSKGKNHRRPLPVPGVAPAAPKGDTAPAKAETRKASHGKHSMRVNTRFLFTTLVAAVCVAVSVHFVHGHFTKSNAAQLLVRGWEADQADRADDAIQLYTQYLQLVDYADGDADAAAAANGSEPYAGPLTTTQILERIGLLLDEGEESYGRMLRAYRTYEEILRREPDNTEIRRRAVTMAMRFQRYRDAVTHLQRLLPADGAAGGPEDARAATLAGECLTFLGKVKPAPRGADTSENAQSHLLNAITWDAGRAEAYLLLASVWLKHPRDAQIDAAARVECLRRFVGPVGAGGIDAQTATTAAYGLLDAMIEHAQDRPQALLRRAGFLLEVVPPDERDAAPQSLADTETRDLFAALDVNQNGVLEAEELAPGDPPPEASAFLKDVRSLWLADGNNDHQLARDEVATRKRRGDRLTRLSAAAQSVRDVLAAGEGSEALAKSRSRAMLLGVEIYQGLAEALAATDVADIDGRTAEDWRSAAANLAADGRTLDHDLRFYAISAELELRGLGASGERAQQSQWDVLERAVEFLNTGRDKVLAALGEQESDPAKRPRVDVWSEIDDDALPLELIRDEQQWQLANVLQIMSVIDARREIALGTARRAVSEAAELEWRTLASLAPQSRIRGFADRVQLIEARRQMAAGDYATARATLERLRGAFPAGSATWRGVMQQLGNCYDRLGNPDARLDLYWVALAADPLWMEGALGEAESLLQVGRVEEALAKLARFASVPEVAERLARLLLVQQAALPAERRDYRRVERLLGVTPANREETVSTAAAATHARASLIADLCLHEAAQSWDRAAGDGPEAQRAAAVSLLDTAQLVLESSRDRRRTEAEAWGALALFAARRLDLSPAERLHRAQQVLREAAEQLGDSGTLRIAAALVASLQPAEAAALLLDGLDRELAEFPAEEQYRVHELMALARARAGDLAKAIESWKSAAAARPADYRPHAAILYLVLAPASEGSGTTVDEALWAESLNRLETIEGGREGQPGPLAAVFRAHRRVTEVSRDTDPARDLKKRAAQLEEPRKWLAAAARQRPYWANIPRLQSVIADLCEQRELAAEYLERAFELGDRSERVVLSLLSYYREQAQTSDAVARQAYLDKAERMLAEVGRQSPDLLSGDVGRAASQLLWQQGKIDEAIGLSRPISETSKKPEDKILLAFQRLERVLRQREATGAAREQELVRIETLFKDAVTLGPALPKTWIALVHFYAIVSRAADAERTVGEAAESLPAEPPHVRPMALGWCHELIAASPGLAADEVARHRQLALEQYKTALATDPASPDLQFALAQFHARSGRPGEALELLDQVVQRDADLTPAGRARVVMTRALTLAAGGRRPETEQALELLRTTDWPDDAWRQQALRAQVGILGRRSGPGDGAAQIQVIEELARLAPLTERERLALAIMYDATANDWEAARREYEALRQDFPASAAPLAGLIGGLLRRAEDDAANVAAARSLLTDLQRLEPDTLRTRTLEARLAAVDGQGAAGARSLAEFVRGRLMTRSAAEVLDQLDERQVTDASLHLAECPAALWDEPTARTLDGIQATARGGRIDIARAELKPLAAAPAVEAELRNVLLVFAAEAAEQAGELPLAEELFREYASRTGRIQAPLVVARFLGRHDRAREGLQVCLAHWDKLPVLTAATTAVPLLRISRASAAESDEVASRLQAAANAEPEQVEKIRLLHLLADLLDYLQRYGDCRAVHVQILKLDPDYLVSLNNLAISLARDGQPLPGLELIERALRNAGPNPSLLDSKGIVLLEAGRTADAIATLSEAVRRGATGVVYVHLAEAKLKAGDRAGAAQALADFRGSGVPLEKLHPQDQAAHQQVSAAVMAP